MIEVFLGNWGTIRCLNEQHRKYLIAAKNYSDLRKATLSWNNNWLYPEMEKEYFTAETRAKNLCDILWFFIPDKTDDLSKSH